ncbi:hypothetical protein Pmani_019920 [Petrolisthes manimaculis]|uniref:Uncharacterized protein n=1 Tax=Petrolisthes manimaculis TaxID=1843537 RepID=A0AAE1U320_9EUCA|nr:hypothetical protein Pmani_019920 [Petrolisthes manimaculis]
MALWARMCISACDCVLWPGVCISVYVLSVLTRLLSQHPLLHPASRHNILFCILPHVSATTSFSASCLTSLSQHPPLHPAPQNIRHCPTSPLLLSSPHPHQNEPPK